MDTRGIEVTNQLRSAICAKLMELGVHYDEELPDYILVMVVNKKSRQQMHADLHLFLESCTTVFVDWLHDQVMKKLQKVTVAKKKSSRELVPMVVVKQEEERKKRKLSATSFLEDQATEQSTDKSSSKTAKDDRSVQKLPTAKSPSLLPNQDSEQTSSKNIEKNTNTVHSKTRTDEALTCGNHEEFSIPKGMQLNSLRIDTMTKDIAMPKISITKTINLQRDERSSESLNKTLKRSLETLSSHNDDVEKKINETKRQKPGEEEDVSFADMGKKLKSYVNKPKITSVVSVKNRLGVSSRKKFEVYREKSEGNDRHRQSEKRFEKYRHENNRNASLQWNKNCETEDRCRRNRDVDTHTINDARNRIDNSKNEKLKNQEQREKVNAGLKTETVKKSVCTVKDRLGITKSNKPQTQSMKVQEIVNYRETKCSEQSRDNSTNNTNIKNRLGPSRFNFRPIHKRPGFTADARPSFSSDDEDCLNLLAEEELDNDSQSLTTTTIPVKSHIVAVNRSLSTKTERKRLKRPEITFNSSQASGYSGHSAKSNQLEILDDGAISDVDDETEDAKLPSKVIVTPRPLKPLQPTQKRATQSLLLRAVAEANQSVVTQKNPEPSLLDKKPVLKRLEAPSTRDVSQNLSVRLNSSKRLVMEKIQVELNTIDNVDAEDTELAPHLPQAVTDEHIGVMMSLFQKSDDKQKFLVTLNGYNNMNAKEEMNNSEQVQSSSPVNEEIIECTYAVQNDQQGLRRRKISPNLLAQMKNMSKENNENHNIVNVHTIDKMPAKRRKLSPIVYNRSCTPSPTHTKWVKKDRIPDKKLENVKPAIPNRSRENCRYWPHCTLRNKCSFVHPDLVCTAFPACKFKDKCAYKHPNCKFGALCTKIGCVFSHPIRQCRFHPYCTKPACPFIHPNVSQASVSDTTSQRSKFTWRRRD